MMAELNEALVKEVLDTLEQRKDALDAVQSMAAKLAEQEKRLAEQDKIIKAVQKRHGDNGARLAALGRWTGGSGKGRVTWEPEKKEAFLEFVCGVLRNDNKALSEWYGTHAKVSLSETTSANGAYLVPDEFYPEIWAIALQSSVYLRDARRIPMNSDVMNFPAYSTGWTVYWTDEGTATTVGEPTFGNIGFTAKKLQAYGLASAEVLDDSAPDLADYLVEQAVQAFGKEIDLKGFGSTGSAPSGITGIGELATNQVTIAANTFDPTFAEVVEGIHKLTGQQAAGAKLYMSSQTLLGNILKLTDTDGMPIWAGAFGASVPQLLAGVPYEVVDAWNPTETTATDFMLYGNLMNLPYGDRRSFRFARSEHIKFAEDQIAMKFNARLALPNLANAPAVKAAFVRWTTSAA